MAADSQNNLNVTGPSLRESILWHAQARLVRPWRELSAWGRMVAVSLAVRDQLAALYERRAAAETGVQKRVYVLSMEYLIGRSLEAHLVNLGLQELCRQTLAGLDTDLDELFEVEPEAGLGIGDVGVAGASILDSLAATGVSGLGYGINYEFGLFSQRIHDGQQVEAPNQWRLRGNPWEVDRQEPAYRIAFGGRVEAAKDAQGEFHPRWVDARSVMAAPCDLFVSGAGGHSPSILRLFTAHASDEFDEPIYEEGAYTKAIEEKAAADLFSKTLYPREDWTSPPRSRLLQEYFLAACSLRDVLETSGIEHISQLPEKAAIHLNDSEPAMAVAELMRILVDQHGLPWETAWELTTRTLSCTIHAQTLDMLEKWPVALIEQLLPRHLQIVYEINERFLREVLRVWPGDNERVRRMSLVEEGPGKQLRMAHLAVVGSHAVASAGSEHSEVVQNTLLPDFAQLWPGKFSGRPAGVSAGRWIGVANQGLSRLITEGLGDGWVANPERLGELELLAGDASFRERFHAVKQANKRRLANFLGLGLDDGSLFDVHLKWIQESKRQLLNVLRVVGDYVRIVEDGYEPPAPTTVLFAGKTMPGDFRGKEIIQLIHGLSHVIEANPRSKQLLRVVFLPDFGVAAAEKVIPAADLSEQISTAGFEPSGAGHIKLAMNGAVTIGTLNGVVIELGDRVGEENIYLFGHGAEDIELLRESGVHPREFYSRSPAVRRVLDLFLTDELSPNEPGRFAWVYHCLVENWDRFHHLADLETYLDAHYRAEADYTNTQEWTRKAILNVARSSGLSSYSALLEYAHDIWEIPARTRASGRG